MKNLILKSLFYTFLATSFVSCVNDDDYNVPALGCTETTLVKTKEVSQIPASATIAQYTADEVIEAYVTTSDEEGNFFKSISFQTLDGTRAFSVPVDVTSTFINFEPGRKVMIKMQNLYTDIKDGDAFYPELPNDFVVTAESEQKHDEKSGLDFRFVTYKIENAE